jgi:S-adenosylmethionine hydrolase
MVQVTCSQEKIAMQFGTIYSDVPQGENILFVNANTGMVQLSINLGNFSKEYNVKAGAKIEIEK